MVSVLSLWLPILLSAVLVFIASSVIHMVLTYHRADYAKLPDEDQVMEALRRFNIPPGDYVIPHAGSAAAMKSPEYVERVTKGPVGFFTVVRSGMPTMGKNLIQWFVFCVVVGIFAAYVAGRALGPGDPYLEVFRFVGSVAFAGYALALIQFSIWFHRAWGATIRSVIDGLIYALLTAGVFGWLWPSM